MEQARRLKAAVLLGDTTLETLTRARALVAAVHAAKPLGYFDTEIVAGLPTIEGGWWQEQAQRLTQGLPHAMVRRLAWERVLANDARRMFEALDLPVSLAEVERVTLPRDWGANFLDCDCWLVVGGTSIGGVYPARPTAVFCPDLAQRRIPAAYADSLGSAFWSEQTTAFRLWRQSSAVVATDPTTAEDLVSYAGVSPDNVIELLSPLDCNLPDPPKFLSRSSQWLLLRIEPDLRYGADKVLCGLRQYLAEGGGLRPMLATETPVEAWRRTSVRPEIALLPSSVREILDEVRIEPVTSLEDWTRLLAQHSLAWLPREHGGDGQLLRQALRSGLRVLCADVLVQRQAHRLVEGAATFYKARCASEIADALHHFERDEPAPSVEAGKPLLGAGDLAREIGFVLDRLREAAHA